MAGKISRKTGIAFLLFLFFSNVIAWAFVIEISKPQELEVTFFDVGQGDSIFIVTPSGQQVLIDGGPSSAVLAKLGKEMPFFDRSIDLVIMTHPDPDHLSGLVEVLKSYRVGLVAEPEVLAETEIYKEWRKEVREKLITEAFLTEGKTIKLSGGIDIEILSPSSQYKNNSDTNLNSIMAKLVFEKESFLFTGDIPSSVEKEVVKEESASLDSNVLKVSHHGSKTSSSDAFLEAVSPKIAVIQVGKDNKYGHPHQEVLERLQRYGIRVLRTDENGNIKIISNGESLKLLTEK